MGGLETTMLRMLSNLKTYASFILEILTELDDVDAVFIETAKLCLLEVCKRHNVDIDRPAFRKEN